MADPYASNVVLALRMDGTNGSTTFVDSSPLNHTVTSSWGAVVSTSVFKHGTGSANFTASGSSLRVPRTDDFNFGTGDFTIEFWLYMPSGKTPYGLMELYDSFIIKKNNLEFPTHFEISIEGPEGTWTNYTANQPYSLDTWEHWAISRASGTLRWFKNGVNCGVWTNVTHDMVDTTSAHLWVGRGPDGYYATGYMDDVWVTKGVARYTSNFDPPGENGPGWVQTFAVSGWVHNALAQPIARKVRVYSEATGALIGETTSDAGTGTYSIATPDNYKVFVVAEGLPSVQTADPYWANDVLQMHMDGTNGSTTFTDLTGKTVTAYGNAQISTAKSKFGGASAYFDGNGDYLSIPDSDAWSFGANDFTIELWVNVSVFPSSGQYPGLICQRVTNISNHSWGLALNGDLGGYVGFGYTFNGTADNYIWCSFSNANVGQWRHIAVCRYSNDLRFFIDGLCVGTANIGSSSLYNSTHPVFVGRLDDSAGHYYNGYIDDLRVTKGVARYLLNFTPPTAAFSEFTTISENAQVYGHVTPI